MKQFPISFLPKVLRVYKKSIFWTERQKRKKIYKKKIKTQPKPTKTQTLKSEGDRRFLHVNIQSLALCAITSSRKSRLVGNQLPHYTSYRSLRLQICQLIPTVASKKTKYQLRGGCQHDAEKDSYSSVFLTITHTLKGA